jgi:uncharacterized membrane protein YhaH (DUF805 family)
MKNFFIILLIFEMIFFTIISFMLLQEIENPSNNLIFVIAFVISLCIFTTCIIPLVRIALKKMRHE